MSLVSCLTILGYKNTWKINFLQHYFQGCSVQSLSVSLSNSLNRPHKSLVIFNYVRAKQTFNLPSQDKCVVVPSPSAGVRGLRGFALWDSDVPIKLILGQAALWAGAPFPHLLLISDYAQTAQYGSSDITEWQNQQYQPECVQQKPLSISNYTDTEIQSELNSL